MRLLQCLKMVSVNRSDVRLQDGGGFVTILHIGPNEYGGAI